MNACAPPSRRPRRHRCCSCRPVRVARDRTGSRCTPLALWPHGAWAAAPRVDGSDDPLGLAALAAAGCGSCATAPQPAPDAAPGVARRCRSADAGSRRCAARSLRRRWLAALLAALALARGAARLAAAGAPRLPLAGLALLALPLVASLQFYVGYPLRVFTAQLSAWLLQACRHRRRAQRRVDDGRRPARDRRRAVLGRADGVDGVLRAPARRRR